MAYRATERLILWDVEVALDWTQRNDAYARLRSRANADHPAITVQAFAEILRVLRLRPGTTARLDTLIAEIKEHLVILAPTVEQAETYAEVVEACRRAPDANVAREAWFAWQIALHRREGHRIMTKAPQRYRGLVVGDGLA